MQSPQKSEPLNVQSQTSSPTSTGQSPGLPPPRISLGSGKPSRENTGATTATQEVGVGCKPSSFFHPTGITARRGAEPVGLFLELSIFFIFVLLRALHPILIDESKVPRVNGEYPYSMESTVVLMTTLLAVFSLLLSYLHGGSKLFGTIWELRPLMVFSINGIVYAVGDYLEMATMSKMHGAAYQILMQSRVLVTASLMTFAKKGVTQTRLQWTLLLILFGGMSTYMVLTTGDDDISALPLKGIAMAIGKVFVSSLGAIITDKYFKVYQKKTPMVVQIARIYTSRAVAIFILSLTGECWTRGFFAGWDAMTWTVTGSFVLKSISSLYVVSFLDSILKNIAESIAVLVIYAYSVLAPWSHEEFDVSIFLSVLVIVSACGAYIDSKSPVDKAKKWDNHLRGGPRVRKRSSLQDLPS